MSDRARRAGVTPYPFEPSGGATLAVTATTGRVALSGDGDQVLVSNVGAKTAYVAFGTVAIEATTARLAILPYEKVLLTIPNSSGETKSTYIAAITATGDITTLQIETGWGV